MSRGKAKGKDREYQVACRDVLIFRDPSLSPFKEDGIDIEFDLPDTRWIIDVALQSTLGYLVIAECRRTKSAVKQEAVAALQYKVDALQRAFGVRVLAAFFTRSSHQLGAVRVCHFNGIDAAVLAEQAAPPGFNIILFRYDQARARKLKHYVMHVTSGKFVVNGNPTTLTLEPS